MPTARQHKKPEVPKEVQEAKNVAKHMYLSLMQAKAPKATQIGYIMGTSMVFKMLIDQACQQGGDRESLKQQAIAYLQQI